MLKIDVLKNKMFLRYISIMVWAMIVPLAIGCVAMSITMQEAKKQVTDNSYVALCHIQRGFTRELDNIKQYALEIALDNDLSSFNYNVANPSSINTLTKLAEKTKVGNGTKQYISKMYIYDGKNGIVISDGAKYGVREFYDIEIAPTGESMSDWQERMHKTQYSKYRYSLGNGEKSVEFMQSYPLGRETLGNIVMTIDHNKLTEYYGVAYGGNRSLYILASDGSLIYSLGEEIYPLKDSYIEMTKTEKAGWFSSEIVFKEGNGSYSFISIEESGAVRANLKSIMIFDVICIILFILLGILLSMYGAYKISKPILEMKKIMSRFYNGKECFELEDMNEKLTAILEGSKNAEAVMNEQKKIIRNNMLKRLVEGNFSSVEEIEHGLDEIGISFNGNSFRVVTVDIEAGKDCDAQTTALAKYAIIKLITEILEKFCNVEVIDNDWKGIIFILNTNKEQRTQEKIYNELVLAEKFITEELNVGADINIGDAHANVRELYRSYQEAKECSEYRMYSGTGRVLAYTKIKNKERRYFYSAEQENEFIRNVIMGNEKASLDCLDELISSHKDGSIAVLRCFFFNLIGTMLKILNSGSIDVAENIDEDCNFDGLFSCRSINELQEAIRRVVVKICGDINLHGNNKKQNLKRAMLEYIENNYCDNAMSLEKLASEFNLNFTYISHFFKEQIGENFSDYIMRMRIEKAKQLLANTDYNISEIAAKVGYATSAVLIKNFKKVENTTPGKYREDASK